MCCGCGSRSRTDQEKPAYETGLHPMLPAVFFKISGLWFSLPWALFPVGVRVDGVYIRYPCRRATPCFSGTYPRGAPWGEGGVIKDCISPYTPQPRAPGDLMAPSSQARAGGRMLPGCD